ncbi:MAG: SUMF1/EgtB/PvdO family nonheme iron enzyme [Anaerolineales bacterium]|nr:SUMF1/EgtB/PvdO family nonheme iron enzyme [Anaerolineales bacterium]
MWGRRRALRGGGWNNNGNNLRVSNRNRNNPDNTNNNIGFRCARSLSQTAPGQNTPSSRRRRVRQESERRRFPSGIPNRPVPGKYRIARLPAAEVSCLEPGTFVHFPL